MSQTGTVPRARGSAPADTPPPSSRALPRPPGRLRRAFEGTPGHLRTAALVGVLVCLVFAVLGGNAFRARGEALDQARADAAQLVRVQQIATDLVTADSLVTNAFLTGNKQGALAVPGYEQAVSEASRLLAQAAQAQPGDAQALAAVNQALTQYTSAVAAAQVNNGLALEVAQAYLRQASALLRTPTQTQPAMLPTLNSVLTADAQRVDDAFAAANRAALLLAVAGLVVLGGLLAVQIWLARRTRRVFNVPLTAGTGLVLAALVLGALTMIFTQSSVDTVRSTNYTATDALARARIAAFDAKSNESLALVDQSAAASYEQQYQKGVATVHEQLAAASDAGAGNAGQDEFGTWTGFHSKIRTADAQGQWSQAVKIATGDSNTAFTAFDGASKTALDTQAGQVADKLGSPHLLLLALGWLTLIVGAAAAVAAWLGVAQRLGEYR